MVVRAVVIAEHWIVIPNKKIGGEGKGVARESAPLEHADCEGGDAGENQADEWTVQKDDTDVDSWEEQEEVEGLQAKEVASWPEPLVAVFGCEHGPTS